MTDVHTTWKQRGTGDKVGLVTDEVLDPNQNPRNAGRRETGSPTSEVYASQFTFREDFLVDRLPFESQGRRTYWRKFCGTKNAARFPEIRRELLMLF